MKELSEMTSEQKMQENIKIQSIKKEVRERVNIYQRSFNNASNQYMSPHRKNDIQAIIRILEKHYDHALALTDALAEKADTMKKGWFVLGFHVKSTNNSALAQGLREGIQQGLLKASDSIANGIIESSNGDISSHRTTQTKNCNNELKNIHSVEDFFIVERTSEKNENSNANSTTYRDFT